MGSKLTNFRFSVFEPNTLDEAYLVIGLQMKYVQKVIVYNLFYCHTQLRVCYTMLQQNF